MFTSWDAIPDHLPFSQKGKIGILALQGAFTEYIKRPRSVGSEAAAPLPRQLADVRGLFVRAMPTRT